MSDVPKVKPMSLRVSVSWTPIFKQRSTCTSIHMRRGTNLVTHTHTHAHFMVNHFQAVADLIFDGEGKHGLKEVCIDVSKDAKKHVCLGVLRMRAQDMCERGDNSKIGKYKHAHMYV